LEVASHCKLGVITFCIGKQVLTVAYFEKILRSIINDMLNRYIFLLIVSFGLLNALSGQQISEGLYNDWDYGPNGVYGNLRLTKITSRSYYKIERADPQTTKVYQINPSGVVINTAVVTFANTNLSRVEEINQWGETYEYRKYTMTAKNEFRVTDLVRGKNIFLPCKYALHIYKGELLSEVQFYSFADKLAEDKNGVAIIQYKRYDDPIRFAERKETSFFDAQRHPVTSKSAEYHTLMSQYDDRDNKVSESYFDIHNEPVTIRKSGVSGMRYVYDADNNQVRVEYHGLDGKITPNIYGIAAADLEYTEGYQMKLTRYDSLGHMTRALASGDGVSVIKYEYDLSGNRIRESYFDESGKPMNSQSGIQEIANSFSPDNMLTQISYLDEFGRPCVDRNKIHTTIYVKDDKNRIIQESSYGLKADPIKTYTEEVFMIKKKYDEYGRNISDSYWADSSTRMPHWDGSYEALTKFNDDGQPVEYCSLDEKGAPFMSEDGSSVMKLIYDTGGVLAERQFLHNDSLINRQAGVSMHYSIVKYGHNPDGNVNELTFWDADRKPVDATVWIKDSIAVHRILFTYRGNRIIEQKYYKAGAGEPFQTIDCLKNEFISSSGIGTGRKNAN
jgi:hypothetical protein